MSKKLFMTDETWKQMFPVLVANLFHSQKFWMDFCILVESALDEKSTSDSRIYVKDIFTAFSILTPPWLSFSTRQWDETFVGVFHGHQKSIFLVTSPITNSESLQDIIFLGQPKHTFIRAKGIENKKSNNNCKWHFLSLTCFSYKWSDTNEFQLKYREKITQELLKTKENCAGAQFYKPMNIDERWFRSFCCRPN